MYWETFRFFFSPVFSKILFGFLECSGGCRSAVFIFYFFGGGLGPVGSQSQGVLKQPFSHIYTYGQYKGRPPTCGAPRHHQGGLFKK